jgi:hypothetical protein
MESWLPPSPFNGDFLPIIDVAEAVLKTGARCWFSMEVFDKGPDGKRGMKYDFEELSKGAMASHRRLLGECVD